MGNSVLSLSDVNERESTPATLPADTDIEFDLESDGRHSEESGSGDDPDTQVSTA